jgi:hypothetical protein
MLLTAWGIFEAAHIQDNPYLDSPLREALGNAGLSEPRTPMGLSCRAHPSILSKLYSDLNSLLIQNFIRPRAGGWSTVPESAGGRIGIRRVRANLCNSPCLWDLRIVKHSWNSAARPHPKMGI